MGVRWVGMGVLKGQALHSGGLGGHSEMASLSFLDSGRRGGGVEWGGVSRRVNFEKGGRWHL